jgi:hypothetical protein
MAGWGPSPAAFMAVERAAQRPIQDTIASMLPPPQLGLMGAQFEAAAANFERRAARQATTLVDALAELPPATSAPASWSRWGSIALPSAPAAPDPFAGAVDPFAGAVDTYRSAFDDLMGSFAASAPSAAAWGGISPPPQAIGGGRGGRSPVPSAWKALKRFRRIADIPPDPVSIVRTSAWPLKGEMRWGLPQKLGWLDLVMEPHLSLARSRERLAQAQGLLYQQHAEGGPNRQF